MSLIQAIRTAMVTDLVLCGMRRNWLPCPAKAYEQRKQWRLRVDLFEFQSIPHGGWAVLDVSRCVV